MSAGYYFGRVSASFASHVFCITNAAILAICFSATPDNATDMSPDVVRDLPRMGTTLHIASNLPASPAVLKR